MFDTFRSNIRTALFGIPLSEARLDVRGFAATTPDKQQRLEDAGQAFIHGYLVALARADASQAGHECDMIAPRLRGFAYEGAAMGLAIIDLIGSGVPRLFKSFIHGPAEKHIYMAHVGAGWALARCPWGFLTFARKLDPLLEPLAIDGVGFHEAFFHPRHYIQNRGISWKRRADPEAFDNGIGRAVWFAAGARSTTVTRVINAFARERRPALWSGLALALTYAGGAERAEIEDVLSAAGDHWGELAVGAAFAAKARLLANNPTDEMALACTLICGINPNSATAVTDSCVQQLSESHDAYRQWRRLIKAELARRRSEKHEDPLMLEVRPRPYS